MEKFGVERTEEDQKLDDARAQAEVFFHVTKTEGKLLEFLSNTEITEDAMKSGCQKEIEKFQTTAKNKYNNPQLKNEIHKSIMSEAMNAIFG